MNDSTNPLLKICPECGADCVASAPRCWMCGGDLSRAETIYQAQAVTASMRGAGNAGAMPVSEWFFAISTCLLLGVVLLVGLGLAVDEPGTAILYAIVVSPALLATLIRTQLKRASHGRVSWAEKFATLMISGALTVSIVTVLCVAACVALFVYCLTVDGAMNFH